MAELGNLNMELSLYFIWVHGIRGYRDLADLLAIDRGQKYSQTINYLRCCLPFAVLCSAVKCICGSWLSVYDPVLERLDVTVFLAKSYSLLTDCI